MKAEFIYKPEGEDAYEERQRLEREKKLEYHRRYYERHRNDIIERNRVWNQSHPERMKELRQQTVFCDACNKNVRKYLYKVHCECKKHQRNMKS